MTAYTTVYKKPNSCTVKNNYRKQDPIIQVFEEEEGEEDEGEEEEGVRGGRGERGRMRRGG